MPIMIETPDDFRAIRQTLTPQTIISKRTGKTISVPCVHTLLVARSLVRANSYNPNAVPKEKMKLLRQSIIDNGFCFPIVTIWDDADEVFVIIDGFHRNLIASGDWLDLEYVPVVFVEHDISKRMYATVQFNKARGVHQVDLDAEVIRSLIEAGQSEDEIADHLGIDLETVHRYKQLTGIADLFKGSEYSMSWGAVEGLEGVHHG